MLNKVHLIGHLGQAPEIKRTQRGERYAALSVATSESWRDRATGERHQRTEWHRVVVWSEPLIEAAAQLKTGAKVWIEGKLASRAWTDDDGVKRYATEIVLQAFRGDLQPLDRKPGERLAVPDPDGPDSYGRSKDYAGA
jgi:single-strand DNA-binding protein